MVCSSASSNNSALEELLHRPASVLLRDGTAPSGHETDAERAAALRRMAFLRAELAALASEEAAVSTRMQSAQLSPSLSLEPGSPVNRTAPSPLSNALMAQATAETAAVEDGDGALETRTQTSLRSDDLQAAGVPTETMAAPGNRTAVHFVAKAARLREELDALEAQEAEKEASAVAAVFHPTPPDPSSTQDFWVDGDNCIACYGEMVGAHVATLK